jgi:hypothetical protein
MRTARIAVRRIAGVLTLCTTALALGAGPAFAVSIGVPNYMIVATGDGSLGATVHLSDSELGALGFNNATSPPQGNPAFPAGTNVISSPIITRDGDVAITKTNGTVTSSNSDIHALNTGPGNPGAQGIDCAGSYAACTDNGSQISSNNRFNTSAPVPSFSALAQNNGVQGPIDLAALASLPDINALSANGSLLINSPIQSDRTDTFGSGLWVIDIDTDGNDLQLQTANWIINGNADTFVIFRVNPGAILDSENGNFLLQGGIGFKNVLFFVDADQGEGSFNFDNTEFYGFTFWDTAGAHDNEAVWNNVRGCGQLITDQINFNNVSMIECAFATSVPEASSLLLLGTALAALVGYRRFRR